MYAFLFMLLNVFGCLYVHAGIEDVQWVSGEWGYAFAKCDACDSEFEVGPVGSLDEAESELEQYFCEDCGFCSDIGNEVCYLLHHCEECGKCVDDGDYCEGCYESEGKLICFDCASDLGYWRDHCPNCGLHFGYYVELCDCPMVDLVGAHCAECSGDQCEICGSCGIIHGEETNIFLPPGCADHFICDQCYRDEPDENHCFVCASCDSEICPDCNLCEDCCEDYEIHCPECNECFFYVINGGYDIWRCESGGDHCYYCCEDNDWLCPQCERCTEGSLLNRCDECGLCDECCLENSEDKDCTHGYCIMSSDFDDHLCPNCMKCPDDMECEYCLLCEECQEDYHCEHGLCPEGDDWEEHLCVDCGDCFDESELCEYCHKCENCNEHCQHNVCPDDSFAEDSDEHFTCPQCDECYEGDERCPNCELCTNCCAANTIMKGCEHGLCIASDEFVENHWCYMDDQCLELCDHETDDCPHDNIDFEWLFDAAAHWQVCIDCGAAVNQQAHYEANTQMLVDPDPSTGKNGTASIICACGYPIGNIAVPPVPIPADGSPYILIQPKDYTGNTSKSAHSEAPYVYATFKVKAGGKNLSYQWYRKSGGAFVPVEDNVEDYEGAQTPELKAIVLTDACDSGCIESGYYQYLCVVSNEHGSVRTNDVFIKAQHVYGYYKPVDDKTHINSCYGECEDGVKGEPEPHRWSEWKLVRPATETQTGLREQTCLVCQDRKYIYLSKVEPEHEHVYDDLQRSVIQHWYNCICGLSSAPEDHQFGPYRVTKEPTEKQYGERVCYCEICDYEKKEKMDRLPHTHNFWNEFVDDPFNTPERGGYSSVQHYVNCKSCEQVKAEKHVFNPWSIGSKATPTKSGSINRECEVCPYVENKFYSYGTYPIMVYGGTANYDAAAPGTRVTVTYDKMENCKWDEGAHWKDMSSEGIGLVPVTLSNGGRTPTVTFTMPNGAVGLEAYIGTCFHTGGTVLGERVEPTCTGYGHEPDKLCADCGAVVEEGARIEPPGRHELTLIPGTEIIAYCTVKVWGGSPNPQPNSLTHGYSGDYLCSRCNKTVKGRRTPIVHGYSYWNGTKYVVDECSDYIYTTENLSHRKDEGCTTWGHSGELYCDFCGGLFSKGYRIEPGGHLWGNWEVIREPSPAVKGMEQRVCRVWGVDHKETRLTDYSGPHYRIKAERSKVDFEFTVGETPEPQTITFESKGRNEVTGIKAVGGPSGSRRRANGGDSFIDVSVDGMSMTFMPNVEAMMADMTMSEKEVVLINSVLTEDGETTDFTAPKIVVTVKINKLDPNLRMAYSVRNTRPGVSFDAPAVTADVEDLPLQWKSSDNSVAAVDPVTGKVTPMQNYGQTTITATYPGNQLYKSSKVSYVLNVISKQGFEGRLWQDVSDAVSGEHVQTEGEPQQVRILPTRTTTGKIDPGKVDITFSGFTMPITGLTLPIFTISGVKVTDFEEDGTVAYALHSPESTLLTFGEGSNAQTFRATLEGFQASGFEVPVLRLTLEGSVTDIIWFGDRFLELDDLITGVSSPVGRKDEGDTYDLKGRKVQKIKQPGIYINNGKKVSAK